MESDEVEVDPVLDPDIRDVVMALLDEGLEGDLDDLLAQQRMLLRQASVLSSSDEPLSLRETEHRGECGVCLLTRRVQVRPCCRLQICSECMRTHCMTQVQQAILNVSCPSYNCNSYVHRDEVFYHLDDETKQKFYQFLVNANNNPHQKTCPRCSLITSVNPEKLRPSSVKKNGFPVVCRNCDLPWCVPCHAPWHEGLTCREYSKGDKLVKSWAKQECKGSANARRCPKCKIFIERVSGCDHMQCNQCHTDFCYKCGERFREIKFIGDHYSRFSIVGCPYRFLSEKPHLRRFVRGSVFGGKLLAAPVLGGLAVGAGAVLLGVGAVVLPFYGSYRLHKYLKKRKIERGARELRRREEVYQIEFPRDVFFDRLEPRPPVVSVPRRPRGCHTCPTRRQLERQLHHLARMRLFLEGDEDTSESVTSRTEAEAPAPAVAQCRQCEDMFGEHVVVTHL